MKTSYARVSVSNQRLLGEFFKASWIGKALQPDKARMMLEKIKTDSLQPKPTVEAIIDNLDKPLPSGYCFDRSRMDEGRL